jgi:sulfate transport system ATP-binding protein
VLPVTVCHGKVWLDDRPLAIPADGVPDGPARLFLRPQDAEVVDDSAGAIAGVVTATHRNAGLRRFDLAIGGANHRLEIALPAADSRNVSGRIAVLPRRWRIYPGERYSKT